MPAPLLRRLILGPACLAALLFGCDQPASDRVIVATSWPAADRQRIESEFAEWTRAHPDSSRPGLVRLDWLILSLGDDLVRLAARRNPPDVLLGGPALAFERLAQASRLVSLELDGSPRWSVVRRAMIGLVTASAREDRTAPVPDRGGVALDDPRHDPISLAWAAAELGNRSFAEGYARLVRAAGDRRRIGREPGSARAAVERGEAERAPGLIAPHRTAPTEISVSGIEGVAILSDGPHPALARSFLQFLTETGRMEPVPGLPDPGPTGDFGLLADLLGATLVDAQDELWLAWSALERTDSPPDKLRWMTEPPPWPPASIAKILERDGDAAMAMVETLAGQIATDPAARAWLIGSWLAPTRRIDREILEELTRAADGRLIREPRLREWLRAEWTAWARQRYRRVLRAVAAPANEGTPARASAAAVREADRNPR